MLRLHLLGHPRLFDGDTPLPPLSPPKALALLAYLLLYREYPVPRDHTAFTLWADAPEDQARANLRRHLHILRNYLPPTFPNRPWIMSNRETLQWNREADYWLDVEAFEQEVKKARRESPDALVHLQAAVNIYNGDLLETFYDEWALDKRQRLREEFAAALERLGHLQEAAGNLGGAIEVAKRLLSLDPLREENHRRLMQLHYLNGDRTAALQQFEACRRLLRETLNIEPMTETHSLRKAIAESHAVPRKNIPQTIPPSTVLEPAEASIKGGAPPAASAVKTGAASAFSAVWRILSRLAMAVSTIALLFSAVHFSTNLNVPLKTLTIGAPFAQDTWITSEHPTTLVDPVFPDLPFKDYSRVHLQFYNGDLDRFLVRFNLTALPPHARVESATFQIHAETWISNSGKNSLQRAYPAEVSVYRIRREWHVETATFNFPWSLPGLAAGTDYDIKPLASQPIHDTTWLVFDITSAVREWIARPNENWGVMLKITHAPEGVAHYWIDTIESPFQERRPRLTIIYR